MFRRLCLTLVAIVFLCLLITPQSFSQFEELFDKLEHLFNQRPDLKLLALMLNEAFPQGIAPLPVESEAPIVAEQLNTELLRRIDVIIASTEKLALDPEQTPEIKDAALRVEAFVQYYRTLIEMANAGAIPLDPGIINQFVNPLFIAWWKPWPEGPENIEEKVFTAEIPIWGAAIIVKEIRGVKLELVRGPLPINPCWWWRLFRIPWVWNWYYYRLMPAEFIKTISYVNTWNATNGRPEVIKEVEKDIIIDEEIMKFWWFLSDPKAAPANPELEESLPMTESSPKQQAIRWGELRSARF